MRLDIDFDWGFKQAPLGCSPATVRSIMGSYRTWEEWMGGNLNDSLYYSGFVFHFNKCDGTGPLEDSHLELIRVCSFDNVFIFDQQLSSLTFFDLRQQIKPLVAESDGLRFKVKPNFREYQPDEMVKHEVEVGRVYMLFDEHGYCEYFSCE